MFIEFSIKDSGMSFNLTINGNINIKVELRINISYIFISGIRNNMTMIEPANHGIKAELKNQCFLDTIPD